MMMTNETELHNALQALEKPYTIEDIENKILELRAKNKKGKKKNVKKK